MKNAAINVLACALVWLLFLFLLGVLLSRWVVCVQFHEKLPGCFLAGLFFTPSSSAVST